MAGGVGERWGQEEDVDVHVGGREERRCLLHIHKHHPSNLPHKELLGLPERRQSLPLQQGHRQPLHLLNQQRGRHQQVHLLMVQVLVWSEPTSTTSVVSEGACCLLMVMQIR